MKIMILRTASDAGMSDTLPADAAVGEDLDESERQMILLALARLSIERPGWDNALNRLALKFDQKKSVAFEEDRATMFDSFRAIAEKHNHPDALMAQVRDEGGKLVIR